MSENTENTNSEQRTPPDFSILFKKRGRPKMKPEDKKPRKRKSKQQTIAEIHPYLQPHVEEQTEGPKDDLQLKIHKLEALKSEWNGYYRRNRNRILARKKQLREAKERMVNECLGIEKVERRGRKCKEINMERIGMIKCLQ
jgi:hypothetical protein